MIGNSMRIFKTRAFVKFADKQQITDAQLIEAITRAEAGLIDANLGSNIIKQRVARKGQGKSGSFRTLIFYRINQNHFFVVGFAKSEQDNISAKNLAALKLLVQQYAAYSTHQIDLLVAQNLLIEVIHNAI